MLVQSVMTLAAPWPLKIVIDNVVVGRKLDPLAGSPDPAVLTSCSSGTSCGDCGLTVIVIAVFNAVASYLANYFTESVGQWVANDLRIAHLPPSAIFIRCAITTHIKSGVLLSTITAAVLTIQKLDSSATARHRGGTCLPSWACWW